MINRFATAGILAAACLALAATPALAQQPGTPAPASSGSSHLPPAAFDGGINFGMRVLNRGVTTTYHPGWSLGGSMHATSIISVIASVTGDYRQATGYTQNIYSYGGGARFQSLSPKGMINPFVQIVMGGAQDNGSGNGRVNHYPFVSPGGGADFAFSKRAAARVTLDFPLYMTFGDVFKGTRFGASVVVPVGQR